jgi:hypothetical protein
MLSDEQIQQLFDELNIPRSRISEGSPIDIHCPFESLHTSHDGRSSCRLWYDEYPHLHCLHVHCSEALQEQNTWLRLLILGTTEFPTASTNIQAKVGNSAGSADFAYAHEVTRNLPKLIDQFRPSTWPLESIEMGVPTFLRRLNVFKPDDLIWIGTEKSSGRPMHAAHFRTLKQWTASPPPLTWSFTTGAAFLPSCFCRSRANVAALRGMILESDSLSPPETFAMARWVEDEFSLTLLAVVSSGNKSLHNYYRHPGQPWLDRYWPALVAAGFDKRTLSPSQPIRLANQVRADNGATQSLLMVRPTQTRVHKTRTPASA